MRTSPYLGGQIRWDIPISSHYEDGKHVVETSGLHIVPLDDNIRFLEDNARDCLHYTHCENIKNLYRCIGDEMYSAEGEWKGANWLYNEGHLLDPYSHTYIMGARRIRFSRYNKQFGFLVPLWISEETDASKFSFIIDVKVTGAERDHIVRTIVRLGDKISAYMNEYLSKSPNYLDPDVSQPAAVRNQYRGVNDNLLNIKFDPDEAYIAGIDVRTGQYQVKDISYIVPNILRREYPVMEFDSMLLTQFASKHLIAQQLINLNFIMNIEDISYFLKAELLGKAITLSINTYYDGKPLEKRDLYTNYTRIPAYRVDKGEFDPVVSVMDYMSDPLLLNYVHSNKFTQPIFHWAMLENPRYIYNFYDGFAPVFYNKDRGEMYRVSGRYFDQADVSKPEHTVYNSAAYWCAYMDMSNTRPDFLWEQIRMDTKNFSNLSQYSDVIVNKDTMIVYINNNRYDLKLMDSKIFADMEALCDKYNVKLSNILLPATNDGGETPWGLPADVLNSYEKDLHSRTVIIDGVEYNYDTLKTQIKPQLDSITGFEENINVIERNMIPYMERIQVLEGEITARETLKATKISEIESKYDEVLEYLDRVIVDVYRVDTDEGIRYIDVLNPDAPPTDQKPTSSKVLEDMDALWQILLAEAGSEENIDTTKQEYIWYRHIRDYADKLDEVGAIYKTITGTTTLQLCPADSATPGAIDYEYRAEGNTDNINYEIHQRHESIRTIKEVQLKSLQDSIDGWQEEIRKANDMIVAYKGGITGIEEAAMEALDRVPFVDYGNDNLNIIVTDLRLAGESYPEEVRKTICMSFVRSNIGNSTLYQFSRWINEKRAENVRMVMNSLFIPRARIPDPGNPGETTFEPYGDSVDRVMGEHKDDYYKILRFIGQLYKCWIPPYQITFDKSVELETLDYTIDGEKPRELNIYKDNAAHTTIYRYTGRLCPLFINIDDEFYKNFTYRYQQWGDVNLPEVQKYINQGKSGLPPDYPSIGYFNLVEEPDSITIPEWYTASGWQWEVSWKNDGIVYELPEVYVDTTGPIDPVPYDVQAEEDTMWNLLYKYIAGCLTRYCKGLTYDEDGNPVLTVWMKHKLKELYKVSYNFEYAKVAIKDKQGNDVKDEQGNTKMKDDINHVDYTVRFELR